VSKSISREAINAAKEKLNIPRLWRMLGLSGEPKASCRSPFRDERHGSFSIFADGRAARDHATGESFDGPQFVAKALGLPIGEAIARFVAMAGGEATNFKSIASLKNADQAPRPATPGKPDLSKFRLTLPTELRTIAHDRGLDYAALVIAGRLGCLKCGQACGFRSWILTDPVGWIAEARRFGRLPYPATSELAERKAHTLRGSCKSWPVGLGVDRALIEKAALIVIVEGGPDLLAAWHFIYRTERWDVVPITILGRAIHGLHVDALTLLKGKRIKFFPHVDPDDGALKQMELISEQLRAIAFRPSYFDLTGLRTRGGKPVKDLNDLVRLDGNKLGELQDLFL
jgi:hypothetical protein